MNEIELQNQGKSIVEQAEAFTIVGVETRTLASEQMRAIKAYEKAVIAHHAEPKKAAELAHKAIVAAEKKLLEPATQAGSILNLKCRTWDAEQERILNAERLRLEKEAREKAEAERAAEAKRLWAEGQRAAAKAVKAAPVVVAPVLMPEPVKQAGEASRVVWKFKIIDASKVPDNFKVVDEVALGKFARAMGPKASCPGVEFYSEKQIAVRS